MKLFKVSEKVLAVWGRQPDDKKTKLLLGVGGRGLLGGGCFGGNN